jgi:hypothetical protein
MSSDEQPAKRGYSAGGLVAFPRPDEVVVPLRQEEFDTLCEGGVHEEKASRDLCIGAAIGAIVGLVGLLATTDWDSALNPEHRLRFLSSLLVLVMMATGSLVGVCVYQLRINRTAANSSFSRLRTRLLRLFDEPRTLDAAIEKLPGPTPDRIGAPPIRWHNVANVFWLGSDLNWTVQALRSGKPKERVVHGLTQSYHHLSELGLAESTPGKLLSTLMLQAQSVQGTALNEQLRNDLAGKIDQIIQDISGLAQSEQPGFQPNPK